MKRLVKKKISLNVVMAILAFLASILVWTIVPDLAKHLSNSALPRSWLVQIDTKPGQLSERVTLLVPAIERVLRSESEVIDLHLVTLTESTVALFRTRENINTENLTERIQSKLATLRESPALQITGFRLFHKAIKPQAAQGDSRVASALEAFDLQVMQTISDAQEQSRNLNIYRYSVPDLKIIFPADSFTDPEVLSTVLQQVQSIEGVQTVFVKNFKLPYVRIQSDSRQMMQTGVSPSLMRSTVENRLAQNSGVNQSVFSQPTYILEMKPQSLDELCNISLPSMRTRSLIRLCDLAEVSLEKATVPYFEIAAPKDYLARALANNSDSGKKSSTSIQILLNPTARALDVEVAVRKILANHPKEKLGTWKLSLGDPPRKPTGQFMVSLILLLAFITVSLKKERERIEERFHLLQILLASSLVASTLLALGIQLVVQDVLIFAAASLAFAIAAHFSRFVRKPTTAIPFWGEFILFSGACLIAVLLTSLLVGDGQVQASTSSVPIVIFIAHCVAFVATQWGTGGAETVMGDTEGRFSVRNLGQGLLLVVAVSLVAAILSIRTTKEPVLLNARFGFDLGVEEKILQKALATISNATAIGVSEKSIGGPLWEKTLGVKPTTFALLNATKANVDDALESLSPSFLGNIEMQSIGGTRQNTAIIDLPMRTLNRNGGTGQSEPQVIEEFNNWLNSMQWPISEAQGSKSESSSRQLFLPLSALMEASWRNELTRSIRTAEGESVVLHWTTSNRYASNAKSVLEELSKTLRRETGANMRFLVRDSRDSQAQLQNLNQIAALVLSGLLLFISTLLFASSERGILAGVTFVAIYLGLNSVSSLYAVLPELLGRPIARINWFPTTSIWAGLFLFMIWATMLRVADYRRGTNMTLSSAFKNQIEFLRVLQSRISIPAYLTAAVAWWWPQTREAGGILLGTMLLIRFFLADWMFFWIYVSERKNRLLLRFRIHLRSLTSASVVIVAFASFDEARAASDTSVVDAKCQSTATVILPIIGRPKGREPAPRRSVFHEKLVQETPCAFSDVSLENEIVKAVEDTRGPSEQGLLVTRLRDIVLRNRKNIEDRVKKIVSRKLQIETILIYGGYYEEFFGNIAFTIIDFRKEGDPVLTKMTFSEENQTQGISQLAEYLRGESIKFYEELLGEGERLPVFIEPVESLDKHPVSENLAGEVSLFLQSRFLYPISFNWFERKTFFRIVKERSKARYVLSTKIRREGTKFYASIVVEPPNLGARRTAWIEGDISQLPYFEEEVLSTSKKALSNIEGIADYCIAPVFDFMSDFNQTTRLYGLAFRQNLGNAAIALRLRSGQHQASEGRSSDTYSLLGFGGGVGWQFFDIRWFVSDLGASVDTGVLSPDSKKSTLQKRSLFLSYGGYLQGQATIRRNWAVLVRTGVEQPILFTDSTTAETIFGPVYANVLMGVGLTF